jgi:hypothetical protein
VAGEGLAAPPGHRWCLGAGGLWHLLPAGAAPTESTDGSGAGGGRTVCGRWPALSPTGDRRWTQVAPALPTDPGTRRPLCARCIGQLRARERLRPRPASQARLL